MIRNLALVACLLLLFPGLAAAQLSIAPSGGANIMVIDGPDGKEAQRVGDLWTKLEVQVPLGEGDDPDDFLGVLGYYDGDDFGGFGLRYYRKASEWAYPGLGFNMTLLDEDRPFVDELTILLGGEILFELWVPGPGDAAFPVTLGFGASVDVVGDDVTMIPVTLALPLELFQ